MPWNILKCTEHNICYHCGTGFKHTFPLLLCSVCSKPEDNHIRSEWPSFNPPGDSLVLPEDARDCRGPLRCRHECILHKESAEIFVCRRDDETLFPLTPVCVCVEFPGKQSPSCPVSGVPPTESYGGIQQNCLLLWRRQQIHKHWGLLWHLCWVHRQIWGERKRLINSHSATVSSFIYSVHSQPAIKLSNIKTHFLNQLMMHNLNGSR